MPKLAGNHVQVLVDGYDITGDSNHISINDSRNVFDVTSFGDEAHRFAPGQRMMSVEHAGFMNSGEAGSHPALKGVDIAGLFSVYLGENAEPRAGDPVFSMLTRQGRYGTLPQVNPAIPFRAFFANRGDDGGWGVALASPTNIVGEFSGSAIDNGGASQEGAVACLHVLEAVDGDAYTFRIEGSDSDAFGGEESVLASFTLDGREIGSEQVKIDGRIPRFIRCVATADPGAPDRVRIAVSLIRTHNPVVLPTAVTPSPQGLLADFQFTARIPSGNRETATVILEEYNRRTGVHWLFLTKQGDAKTDIDLAGLAWDAADDAPTSNSFGRGRPTFFGAGDHDWQLLPSLLPNSSFYIYLPRDKQIYEFAVTANNEAANHFLSFATTPRPASVVTGSPIRVLVADSGQANLIKNWIGAGNRPEVVQPPAKPRTLGLASDDGQVTVTITPPDSGGAPISSYELNYRAAGSKARPNFLGNLGEEPIVTGLTNGKPYEFRALAVNRGGRGPWSAYASIIAAPRPQGLLAYFQFVARVPATWDQDHAEIILEGYHDRTGADMLQLTKADDTKSDISLEGIAWEAASDTHSSNFFGQGRPTFFGGGEDEWQLLPTLLPNSSFYICLPSDGQIWEFPITGNNEAANHFLSFNTTPRPDSVLDGSKLSVLVADSGQANRIKDWMAAGNQPEVIAPPAKPQAPTLVADDGQVAVTIIPPAQGGAPISSYELGYREAESGGLDTVINLYSPSHTVTNLTNGASYEFRVLAVNRGGRGTWSDYASVTLPPQGLMTDFEFTSRDPSGNRLLGSSDQVTGGRWLNLTKSNNKKTDIEIQALNWRTGTGNALLEFSGEFLHEWENIPSSLSNDSFYIYLSSDEQIYEFPVSSKTFSDGSRLRFGSTARPTSIATGSSIRVLVADSGQAQGIKDWIGEGNQPEVIELPGKPQPPILTVSSGKIIATFTPPAEGGAPITTYDLDIRQGLTGQFYLPLIDSLSYTFVATSGEFRFRVAAINRGGRGPWSEYATATAQS